ncbi:bacillithiol biosynthesis cysteine-adding enzyme BshC [Hanstruepera neustonica]|uniref:Putative cysteine ligase BshC n=1 Tax=Hanstruepera neustonica TaxID=1445657 RepID=A0A2K1E042_9FLAO|nr:bacillithiol biosynthesis cysteine-adding enzyme BshC [Hanstruepera neustonica]PNQ73638.1 bacillithiol biosynthesis cysteine-adding enzyme BshC [Hanstruepera neustonica]
MHSECIPFKETGYFSDLICDYLEESAQLKPFYNRFPNIENFKAQIVEKQSNYSKQSRQVLVDSIKNQYQNIHVSKETELNIESLNQENTFTITTGHQLNLFTGPLYFFYKIVSAINLCKDLKKQYPEYNFVPVYWMASEDHDFEEINFFNYQGKKVQWSKNVSGAVGESSLEGLDEVCKVFSGELGPGKNADALKNLFKESYLNHNTLTGATRYLVNSLFSKHGLVILDGNDADLKRLFVPFIKEELINNISFKNVSETNERLNKLDTNYKIQVNPREINLFYLDKNLRERIVEEDGKYHVLETDLFWSKEELMTEVEKHPEQFSPNVITRPLYQEVVLPNLCYIGGGGELAYWFQLKSNFESQNIPFPILLLRNSVLLFSKKQKGKLDKLDVTIKDLFLKQDHLISKVTKQLSKIDIDFSSQKEFLNKQFKDLYALAEQTDKSFVGAVAAQERKQIKGLEHLEKRLLKAQKRKFQDHIERITEIQKELFPNQSLQERQANFSSFYLEFGDQLIDELVLNLQPLKGEFTILNLD